MLDVACGTGIAARLATPRVGPTGQVVGVDLNAAMVAVARAVSTDMPIAWREGSAVALPCPDATFEVVLCQQGLQFMPDRLAALREMHRVLVPGGRLGLSVWQSLPANPGATALATAVERHLGPEAAALRRAPYALGEAEALHTLLRAAGFRAIRIDAAVRTVRFPSIEIFVFGTLLAGAAYVGSIPVSEATRVAILEDTHMTLQDYVDADGVAFPMAAHLAIAHR